MDLLSSASAWASPDLRRRGRARPRRLIRTSYLLSLHLVAVLAALSPATVCRVQAAFFDDPSLQYGYRGQVEAHLVEERSAPPGCVVFLGDSMTARLDTRLFTSGPALGFGIGGDTTVGLLSRLPRYQSLATARAVVLAIGVNDLSHSDLPAIARRYRALLQGIPAGRPVLVSAVLPINESLYHQANITYVNRRRLDNRAIRALNAEIQEIARATPGSVFVDPTPAMVDATGNLDARFTVDGEHLSDQGYVAWASVLGPALERLPAPPPS